jgi:hypothetical protein
MAICGCGLPACCCQPAVAGGVIYADLWGELSTHLAPQALFTQSSVHDVTSSSFPLSKHTGGGETAPTFSGWLVCLQLMWEVAFPPLLWSFPPSTTLTSFTAPGCWVRAPTPALSGQTWLVYLQFWEGFPSPLFGAQGAPLSLLYVFIVLIAYYSVSLFSLGGGRSVHGAMLFWLRDVCGSTTYHLAHLLVCIFPSRLGTGDWRQPGGPPGFSVQCEVRCSVQAGGVEGSKFCLFSLALPARCVSSISPRFHFRRHAFCFLPLAAILEKSADYYLDLNCIVYQSAQFLDDGSDRT